MSFSGNSLPTNNYRVLVKLLSLHEVYRCDGFVLVIVDVSVLIINRNGQSKWLSGGKSKRITCLGYICPNNFVVRKERKLELSREVANVLSISSCILLEKIHVCLAISAVGAEISSCCLCAVVGCNITVYPQKGSSFVFGLVRNESVVGKGKVAISFWITRVENSTSILTLNMSFGFHHYCVVLKQVPIYA